MSRGHRTAVLTAFGAAIAFVALTPGALAKGGNVGNVTGITIPGFGGGGRSTTTTVPRTTTTSTTVPKTTTTSTTVVQPTTTTTAPAATTTTTSVPTATGLVAGVATYSTNETAASANAKKVVATLGHAPALLSDFFEFYGSGGNHMPFPSSYVQTVYSLGSTPMVTWRPDLPTADNQSVLTSISSGSEDSYIQAWATAAKNVGRPVYVRFMHEMNGDWYPWGQVSAYRTALTDAPGYYPYSNTPQMYVAAFQHVVSIFQSVGATNVRFVWCPSATAPTSQLAALYPGDTDVQWTGLDGYNRSGSKPISFAGRFGTPYNVIAAFSQKPMMIAEMASVEFSGLSTSPSSKAQWIAATYSAIPTNFPLVRSVQWFDATGKNGESFPFDSSSASLAALQSVMSNASYAARAS